MPMTPTETKPWTDTIGRVQHMPSLRDLTPHDGLDKQHGVCICGHTGQWHDRGEPGETFEYHGPCLVGLCACKGYVYSRWTLGHLISGYSPTDA